MRSDGRLGNGDADTAAHATPIKIIEGDRMRDLAAGIDHTCALGVDRELVCWGANGEGQLGAGDTAARATPTLVGAAAFCPRP